MANSDKDILITPNSGSSTADPKIEYVGADSSGNDTITIETLYDGTKTTLSFEGSAGQLFSVVNDLTSDPIFSVNDVSGIPSIEVDSDGEIRIAEFSGNVGIGKSSPTTKLDIDGSFKVSGASTFNGTVTLSGGGQIGSQFTVSDDWSFDGVDYGIVFDASASAFEWQDNAKATFGTGDDYSIYYDATNLYIEGTGDFKVGASTGFMFATGYGVGAQTYMEGDYTTGIKLMQGGSTRLQTTSEGVDITGRLDVSQDIRLRGGSGSGDVGVARIFIPDSAGSLSFDAGNDGTNMILTATGLGIGTTDPDQPLHVKGSRPIRLERASVGEYEFSIDNVVTGDDLDFVIEPVSGSVSAGFQVRTRQTDGTLLSPFSINHDGQVGIGTIDPQDLLHLSADSPVLRLTNTSDTGVSSIEFWDNQSGTSQAGEIFYNDSGNLFGLQGNANGIVFKASNTFPGSELMRLTSGGNLGIGTGSSPRNKLDVISGSDGKFRLSPYGPYFHNLTDSSNERYIHARADGKLSIGYVAIANLTGGTGGYASTTYDHITINTDGDVGIGTDSPSFPLHVATDGNTIAKYETSLTSDLAIQLTNSQGSMFFGLGGGEEFAVATDGDLNGSNNLFAIKQTGNVGIGTTSPVAKLDVLGTAGGPTVYDYSYATNSGIRIHGDEAGMDIVGTDANNHASSFLLRNGNEGFAFINNSTSNRLELKSFNATADAFTVHSTGSNVSNLTTILTLAKAGGITFNDAYTFPTSDGNANDVLQTDGSGNLSFAAASGGTITSATNMVDNRVLTASGSTTINGESGLTYNGSTLDITGNVIIDTNPATTYGVSEALRIDDTGGTADRQLQFFELCNAGARSHRIAFNTNITTTGSAYTHTQGLYGGSSAIHFGNSGEVVFYVNGQVTSGSTDAITPTERLRIHSDGKVKVTGSGTIGGSTVGNGYLQITDGSTTMGLDSNEIHTTDTLFLQSETGNVRFRGNNSAGTTLWNGGTTFMNASRDLFNIGTISSGAITSSGTMTINEGNAFTDLNIKSDRTSGNIGGVNFVNASDAIKGQIFGHTDGSVEIASGGQTQALLLDASQDATFAGRITASDQIEAAGAIRITETGTSQKILIGNQDSSGANKPAIIQGVNGNLRFGYGDSWASTGEGGTFTESLNLTGSDATFAGNVTALGGNLTIKEFTGATAYSQIKKTNTGSNLAIVSQESIYMMLDANADQTNRSFFVTRDSDTPGSGSTLFSVTEGGTTSAIDLDVSGDLDLTNSTSTVLLDQNVIIDKSSGTLRFGSTGNDDINVEFKGFGGNKLALTDGVASFPTANVGIGETSPQNPLHVRSDSASGENYAIQIDNNNTTVGSQIGMLFRSRVGTTNTDFSIRGIANGTDDMDLTFNSDDGSERLRITKDGLVGIGTDNPDYRLELLDASNIQLKLTSNSASNNTRIQFAPNDDNKWNMGVDAATSEFTFYDITTATVPIRFEQGAAQNTLVVDANSRVGIGTNAPDKTLQVQGASTPTIRVEDTTNTVRLDMASFDSGASVGTTSSHDLNINYAGSPVVKMTDFKRIFHGGDNKQLQNLWYGGSVKGYQYADTRDYMVKKGHHAGAGYVIFQAGSSHVLTPYLNNTNVYLNDELLLSNIDAFTANSISSTNLTVYDVITADKPFVITESNPRQMCAPLSFGSNTLLSYHDRYYPITFYLYSPYSKVTVNVYKSTNTVVDTSGTPTYTFDIAAGGGYSFAESGASGTNRWVFKATGYIVGYSKPSGGDGTLLVPAGQEVVSNTFAAEIVYINDGTNQTNVSNVTNGSAKFIQEKTGDRNLGTGAFGTADGAGGDAEYGVPVEFLSDYYIYPEEDITNFRLVSYKDNHIQVLDKDGNRLYTYDHSAATKEVPLYASEGTETGAGSALNSNGPFRFIGTAPFHLVCQNASDYECVMLGALQEQVSQNQNKFRGGFLANPLTVSTADNVVATLTSTDAGAQLFITDTTSTSNIATSGGELILEADVGDIASNSNIVFKTDTATRMKIDSSGKVGIAGATTIDDGNLQIGDSDADFNIAIAGARSKFGYDSSNNSAVVQGGVTKGIIFCVNNNTLGSGEAARIDSSGNLLVGKTSADDFSTAGVQIEPAGQITASISGDAPIKVNRGSSDGSIIELNKGGAIVGKLGSVLGDLSVSTLFIADPGNVGIRFDQASTDDIQPCNSTGGDRDDAINLGAADNRFRDLYLSNFAEVGSKLDVVGGEIDVDGDLTIHKDGTHLKLGDCDDADRVASISLFANGIGAPMMHLDADDGANYMFGSSNACEFKFTNTGTLHADADVIAYSTTIGSDRRLKQNIRALEDPLHKVLDLQGVKFDWKDEKRGTNQIGFIAQEVEEVLPEVVSEVESLDGSGEHKVVNYSAIVPVLVEAIKTQQKEIEELKKLAHPKCGIESFEGYADLVARIEKLENK